MKITVIGTGYVGLVQAVCLADLGNDVIGVDVDEAKVKELRGGKSPIYEPGLTELLERNLKEGRLHFTTKIHEGIADTAMVFIAVGTPSQPDGRANLQYVESAAHAIGKALTESDRKEPLLIVNKSTVPIGTGDLVGRLISEQYHGRITIVSNPEFLREGSAISDFMSPDRIVLGFDDATNETKELLTKLYAPLRSQILMTDVKTAELIKYASNAMLATQISFINSIAQIAEAVGADVTQVAAGMRLDTRIGQRAFLDAGVGYGGSCFPKDVQALIRMAHDAGVHFGILEATEDVNKLQRQLIVRKAQTLLPSLTGASIGIWGVAFKAKTDDLREAPALDVIQSLLELGATVKAYDPVAAPAAAKLLPTVEFTKTAFDAAKDADLLLVLTNWDEFRQLDLAKLKKLMKTAQVVDGRNIYDPTEMGQHGFHYLSIGRPTVSSTQAGQ